MRPGTCPDRDPECSAVDGLLVEGRVVGGGLAGELVPVHVGRARDLGAAVLQVRGLVDEGHLAQRATVLADAHAGVGHVVAEDLGLAHQLVVAVVGVQLQLAVGLVDVGEGEEAGARARQLGVLGDLDAARQVDVLADGQLLEVVPAHDEGGAVLADDVDPLAVAVLAVADEAGEVADVAVVVDELHGLGDGVVDQHVHDEAVALLGDELVLGVEHGLGDRRREDAGLADAQVGGLVEAHELRRLGEAVDLDGRVGAVVDLGDDVEVLLAVDAVAEARERVAGDVDAPLGVVGGLLVLAGVDGVAQEREGQDGGREVQGTLPCQRAP